MGDLENRAYAIKQLKQEYGIGSKEALAYLKSQEAYEKLRNEVRDKTRELGGDFNLSLRETNNLCTNFHGILEHYVQTSIDLISAERNEQYRSDSEFQERDFMISKPSEKGDIDFDYKSYLITVGLRGIERPDIVQIKGLVAIALLSQSFILGKRTLNCEDMIKELTSDKMRIGPWVRPNYPEDMRRDTVEISRQEIENFTDWLDGRVESLSSCPVKRLDEPTDEELRFLYGLFGQKGIYERAVEEQKLRDLHTERKIALIEVLKKDLDIDLAIKNLENERDPLISKIGRFKEHEDPSFIHTALATWHERILEEIRYKIPAIKKNRKWLEQFIRG